MEPEEAKAQFNLGIMYAMGRDGVAQNHIKAVKWFRKAADQGDDDAQFNLGVMYENGWGVTQSYTESIKWYTRAAEQGDADAQFNLGAMYAKGHGISQNYVHAYMWFMLSATNGENYVRVCMDIIIRDMTPEQIAEAQDLASKWRVKTWEDVMSLEASSPPISKSTHPPFEEF